MRKDFLVFGSPRIEEEEIQEVVATLRSGWIGTGPRVGKFEAAFRDYTGARHAMALSSCTAALHLSMVAIGVGPGDEVITAPLTFAATANSVLHTGAHPVFVDVDRDTMLIDPEKVREYIERECYIDTKTGLPINRRSRRKVRAILPVHLTGRPCRMDDLKALADQYHLYLIEDAAHAIEAEYHGRKIGTIGDLTCFSFYVTKNVVTGEGGMVTTDDERLADCIKVYGLHGMSKHAWQRYSDKGFVHYEVLYPGFKYNMMDLQAALGIHQLRRVETYLRRREEVWNRYDEAFRTLPVRTPAPAEPDTLHARHLYTILVDADGVGKTRDEFQQTLFNANIGTGIHYTALHLHPYYHETFGYRRGDYLNAEYVSDRTLSLPLSARLTDQDVEDVIQAVRAACASAPAKSS